MAVCRTVYIWYRYVYIYRYAGIYTGTIVVLRSYSIRRTIDYDPSRDNICVELRDINRSLLIVMGANGTIEDCRHAKDQTHIALRSSLGVIVEKSHLFKKPLPKYYSTDNYTKDTGTHTFRTL